MTRPTENRCLYNGDCNYLFAHDYRRPDDRHGPYTARVVRDHVTLVAESGVDTFVMNANGQVPWYPSKALPHVLTGYSRGLREHVLPFFPPLDDTFTAEMRDEAVDIQIGMLDRFLDLADSGVDWLAEVADACRQNGISPWVSVRMNDAHGANNWDEAYFNCPPQRDERFRLSGKRLDPDRGVDKYFMVCNYEHREVRDYYLTLIRELLTDYDFNGIELDWLRTAYCCEPPASQRTIDMMTDWIGEVREIAGGKTLSLRIPCRLGALRTVGLDVPAMAARGLIDCVAPSNFWQTTWDVPYERLREELGDGVTVYGMIEDAPNWLFASAGEGGPSGYRLLSTSAELLRGNAAGKLAAGVDGIEFYNFFCSDSGGTHISSAAGTAKYNAIKGLADLDFLRGKPKQYTLATSYNYWSLRFFERADQLPATIENGGCLSFELSMCAEPPEAELSLIVQIVIERTENPTRLGVGLNGGWPTFDGAETDHLLFPVGAYSYHVPEHLALNYRLSVEQIRDGWNEVRLYHSEDLKYPHPGPAKESARVLSVELAVLPRS